MKDELMYIELKTGFSGNGPAWIGKVEFSKSGQTIYFNNKGLKRMKGTGISSNHYDLETGEQYWISGIKKNGEDRHWAGGGKVFIDKNCVDEYLGKVNFKKLDKNRFELIEIKNTDKKRFQSIENESLEKE